MLSVRIIFSRLCTSFGLGEEEERQPLDVNWLSKELLHLHNFSCLW